MQGGQVRIVGRPTFGKSRTIMKSPLFAQPVALQAQSLFQQATTLHQQGLLPEALTCYQKVMQLQPRHFDALNLSGVIALQLGDAQQAVELFNKAAKIEREHPGIHINRGTAYQQLGDLELALTNFNKAVALAPTNDKAFNNRGNVLVRMNRLDEALRDFDHALQLKDDYSGHNNRGLALGELMRHDEGVSAFERAIALAPESVDAHWNLGMALLRIGQFERGWRESEWRLQRPALLGLLTHQNTPRWDGHASLQGKTILLCHEQGLGDTIQFARYASLVKARGARVLLLVQPALRPLLSTLEGIEVFGSDDPLPTFDCHIPLLSLPMIFQSDERHIPTPPLGLHATPEALAQWQQRLGERRRPRIGVAWSGNTAHVDDHKRSLPLTSLLQQLSGLDVDWICLQKDLSATDEATLAARADIRHFGAELQDFNDTAALCTLMDVVVSVDTSVAHLAATLGKPTWVMLAQNPDWRWLLGRTDSPWYPSARLYRQDTRGDWAGVLQKIRADLSALFITP